MKKLLIVVALMGALYGIGTSTSVAAFSVPSSPVSTQFAACAPGRILTFPTWYNHLPQNANCSVQITSLDQLWIIALNIIEMGMWAAGYITAALLIWGGIMYIKSQGDPTQLTAAKSTILNAVVGLAVVMSSVAIVNFIAGRFSG